MCDFCLFENTAVKHLKFSRLLRIFLLDTCNDCSVGLLVNSKRKIYSWAFIKEGKSEILKQGKKVTENGGEF